MRPETPLLLRIRFLVRVVEKECRHLQTTDARLFDGSFALDEMVALEENPDLAERIEAFVSRLGRLQDTLGDKFLPTLLTALQEKTGAVIDNLDKAERLGWLDSTENWIALRKLRNLMVHEYIEDPLQLWNALQTGHDRIPELIGAAQRMIGEVSSRGWNQC